LLRDGPRLTFSGSFEIFEKPSRCGSKRTAAFKRNERTDPISGDNEADKD
jgi:hypothetical protein